jgi:hypothetical protein
MPLPLEGRRGRESGVACRHSHSPFLPSNKLNNTLQPRLLKKNIKSKKKKTRPKLLCVLLMNMHYECIQYVFKTF